MAGGPIGGVGGLGRPAAPAGPSVQIFGGSINATLTVAMNSAFTGQQVGVNEINSPTHGTASSPNIHSYLLGRAATIRNLRFYAQTNPLLAGEEVHLNVWTYSDPVAWTYQELDALLVNASGSPVLLEDLSEIATAPSAADPWPSELGCTIRPNNLGANRLIRGWFTFEVEYV